MGSFSRDVLFATSCYWLSLLAYIACYKLSKASSLHVFQVIDNTLSQFLIYLALLLRSSGLQLNFIVIQELGTSVWLSLFS